VRFEPWILGTQTSGLSAREAGWGFTPEVLKGWAFRATCLATPLWLPLFVLLVLGRAGGPAAITLLLALFVPIPGIYVLANVSAWPKAVRLLTSVAYGLASLPVAYAAARVFSRAFSL